MKCTSAGSNLQARYIRMLNGCHRALLVCRGERLGQMGVFGYRGVRRETFCC